MKFGRTTTATGLLVSAGSLAVVAVFFVAAELVARAWFVEGCANLASERQRIDNARRYLEPCGATARRDGVSRIAVVGASSADLLARQLTARLRAPECGGRYEVSNCAQPGSALEHVELRFDEVLKDDPDAILLLFGHNIAFRFEVDETVLQLEAIRARSCLMSQLAPERAGGPSPLEDRLAALERFLRRAAAETRARGIPLVVATMPANLWIPQEVDRDDRYDPRFLEAQFHAARGRGDDALRRIEALAEARDRPYWHYQLGEQLARAGDVENAYRELHRALDADHLGVRAPGRLNDLVRSIVAQEGLLLRDTERVIEAHAPGGLPGWESFIDNCHLLPEAIDREVDGLLDLLRDVPLDLPPDCGSRSSSIDRKGLGDVLVGVFDLAASAPPGLAKRWYLALSLAVESWMGRDPAGAERDVAEFLAGPKFSSRRDENGADLLVAVAEGYYRAGRRERAIDLNEQARAAGSAAAWVQKGLFHVRQEQADEASEAFEQALTLDNSREDARTFLTFLSSPD